MKKHVSMCAASVLLAAAAVLLGIGLSSCRESLPDTMNLTLRLDHETAVMRSTEFVISPDPGIVEYRIIGEGPRGGSFDQRTVSSELVIDGLIVGTWSITAQGLNESGDVIIEGTAESRLSHDNRDISIHLTRAQGSGTVFLPFTWDPEELETSVEGLTVTFTRKDIEGSTPVTDTASFGTGSGFFEKVLPAGDYAMQFTLIDSQGEMISGAARTVQIYPESRTETKNQEAIHLDEEFPSVDVSLSLEDINVSPITGTITGAPLVIYGEEPLQLSYTPDDPDSVDLGDVTSEWYVNGNLVRTLEGSLKTSFIPASGYHRLDAHVYSSKPGSLASASIEFDALDHNLTEDMKLIQSLADGEDGARLRSVSDIAVSVQGHIAAASPTDDHVQVFQQHYDGTLVPRYMLEADADLPLRGAAAAAFSPDGSYLCILSGQDASISIFGYNPVIDQYAYVTSVQEQLHGSSGPRSIDRLSDVVIAPNNTDLYVSDQGADEIYHMKWDGQQLHYYGTADVSGTPGLSSPRKMAVDSSGRYLASANMDNSSLQIFAVDFDGSLHRSQAFSYSYDGTMGISKINNAVFLNDGSLLTTSNNFLCHFQYDQEFSYSYRLREGDLEGCRMSGLRTAAAAESRDRVFVGNVTSRGITVFDRHEDNTLTCQSFTPAAPIHQLAADHTESYLFAISTSEHALFVFDIR